MECDPDWKGGVFLGWSVSVIGWGGGVTGVGSGNHKNYNHARSQLEIKPRYFEVRCSTEDLSVCLSVRMSVGLSVR